MELEAGDWGSVTAALSEPQTRPFLALYRALRGISGRWDIHPTGRFVTEWLEA